MSNYMLHYLHSCCMYVHYRRTRKKQRLQQTTFVSVNNNSIALALVVIVTPIFSGRERERERERRGSLLRFYGLRLNHSLVRGVAAQRRCRCAGNKGNHGRFF